MSARLERLHNVKRCPRCFADDNFFDGTGCTNCGYDSGKKESLTLLYLWLFGFSVLIVCGFVKIVEIIVMVIG